MSTSRLINKPGPLARNRNRPSFFDDTTIRRYYVQISRRRLVSSVLDSGLRIRWILYYASSLIQPSSVGMTVSYRSTSDK